MFLWNVNSILRKIERYMPDTYNALSGILEISDKEVEKYLEKNYNKTDSISIDYGILEKDDNIYVIPTDIGWDDVGSWSAIERYCSRDEHNNIHKGNVKSVDSSNNIIITNNETVVIDGVSDIYVIENEGMIFIGKRDKINNVKWLKELFE